MKKLKWPILIFLFAGVSLGGYFYWQREALHPATSDAFVRTHVVRIAAQVSGPVIKLYVEDQQSVKKGTLLFEIDPAPYQIALQQAQAQLELTDQENAAAEAAIHTAQAGVQERQAQLTDVRKNTPRILRLVKEGNLPESKGDDARSALKKARAALMAARSELKRARKQLGEPGLANARLRVAQATLARAKLDLQHTRIIASTDGIIANLTLRPGTMVQTGQSLFALVEKNDWWVNANYKETDLARIRVGQAAQIQVDMYPDHRFEGMVVSINPASGSAFSLLPPENATGNWVKVTQRFPVKVRILDLDSAFPLRIGASAQVMIDTTSVPDPATP